MGIRRIILCLAGLFWLLMNVWLWRWEFGSATRTGSPVPAALVWQRMLTAPDPSTLEIVRRGTKIGYCRWSPNVGETLATGPTHAADEPLEGMIRKPGYALDLEWNFALNSPTNKLRGNLHLEFNAHQEWQAFSLAINLRPSLWTLEGDAAREYLTVKYQDDRLQWDRQLSFAELRQPEVLLSEFGLLLPPQWLGWLRSSSTQASSRWPGAWQASNDRLQIGHAHTRIYRLRAQLWDRYQAQLDVSRAGEILRVELPEGLSLRNDALITW